MSKFKSNKIYIIIDDSDITTEMINYSTSMTKESMPSKVVNGVTKRLLETEVPLRIIYSTYVVYCIDSINSAWDALS